MRSQFGYGRYAKGQQRGTFPTDQTAYPGGTARHAKLETAILSKGRTRSIKEDEGPEGT